ncbi:putative voltage-gated potassium channel subunit beta [Phytophthora idaei]|nr:putative voltage-gated potassium channel subunit beta [Phytophthora idaei]KAG3143536.1 putative voltage-gated potassium channel subunit beta [Phytophthora idaei]KAG3239483.1 putative voltage-gated potassium channel subunit beta [Phytophthora idaei]
MCDNTREHMPYRFLGDSGLLVSRLSLGSWMDTDEKYTVDAWYEMMALAFKYGINVFDNAEIYGAGLAERNMGGAIRKVIANGTWGREDLVITTKLYLGSKGFVGAGPNDQGIGRKHILEGTKASLTRLQLDYVDVLYCHRSEVFTPVEETVRAMSYVINKGWALYWGTSSWGSADFQEACDIADRLGLIRPIVEQPEYNLIERSKVEFEYVDLYKKYKLGLTTWSPLSYGALTGKYSSGTPDGSRLSSDYWKVFTSDFADRVAKANKLKPIAESLGLSMVVFAIAWCLSNENVSTVLIGAKTTKQLEQNLAALKVVELITPEVKATVDHLIPCIPKLGQPDEVAMIRGRHL